MSPGDSILDLRPLSELKPQPVEWFWPGYLAVGSLAILDGDPGQGKSLVTLDLAARITAGRPWPDGAAMPRPASVLLICCEDVDSVIYSRLQTAGADLGRVFLWPRQSTPGQTSLGAALPGDALPRFPSDIRRLDLALTQTHAKLVIIDPIMSFLDRSVMSASDASVRRALQPLAHVADKHGCVILMVRHLNKSPTARALYRGGGSIGFVAACRLAWLAAPDPRHDDRSILAQTKNNYAPRHASLAYTIESPTRCGRTFSTCAFGRVENVPPHPADAPPATGQPGKDQPRLTWLGPIPWTADELSTRRPRPSHRRARDFLRRFLAAGPRTSDEIWTAATNLGLSRNTLYRAKTDLDIRSTRTPDGLKRLASWHLPEHDPATPSETPELDAWLNRWHDLHADANPLEDDEPRRFAG